MHILVPIAFVLIIESMVSALYFMMHDRGTTQRMVWSMATRVGLSITLFLSIRFANWMGWIQPTGMRLRAFVDATFPEHAQGGRSSPTP
jgi:Protein of unknown function (DUF2909)